MRTFKFKLVDAFTTQPLSGNPCAIVLAADTLNEKEMQRIAAEMNQSETAFLMKSQVADLKARYFTPRREIPLAGHPTIASIHAAIESGLIQAPGSSSSFQLELRDGPIRVDYERGVVRMFQRKPRFLSVHDPSIVAPLFGLDPRDLADGYPIQTVSTGTPMLMILARSLEILKKIEFEASAYRKYMESSDFFSPHLFCLQGITPEATTFARHPGLSGEDAFTGSATGCMAAYLWHHRLIQNPSFIAEQGHWMGRPGQARVVVLGPPEDIVSVSVAGSAVTVLEGSLKLPEQ